MRITLKKCVLLLLISASVFAQEHEQGLVNNAPFWRYALGGSVLSLPSVQAQSAVVALDGGNIKAYSAAGNLMWSYSARGRISPYVSRSREGTSYLSRTNGTFIAVNRAGRELWRRNLGSPLVGRVVFGWDGRLFVPADKKLFCYTASGTLLWTKTFTHSYLLAPKIDPQGRVLFALRNNHVYRIDPFSNVSIWEMSATPIVLLPVEQNRIVAVHADGTLEILGADDNWYIAAGEDGHASVLPRIPGRPVTAISRGNNIASVINDGRVVLISIDERRVVWTGDSHIREASRRGTSPDLEVEMLFDERGIYILNKTGATGFTADGRRLWFTYLNRAAAVPAFGDDGVLYSGGRDWILYAYKIEDRVLPRSGGVFGPAPEGVYGTGTPQAAHMPRIPVFNDEISSMLDNMQASISDGNVGNNELPWTSFLLTLSARQGQLIQYRVRALQLLGQIGSRETIPWLVNIFKRDTEPLVRAAAITAIGSIGVDPEGLAIQSFLQALIPDTIKDEQILFALTKATGDICRFSGPPLSETGIRILNLLTANGQPAGIRNQAERELASLR
ncbi:MAG: PQQ-binding-like beta-propeller repeat protein [Treponema sp.]|jgi:outer membrane protein assembly factor BamB|nr:PQQ-binding-like beta-propeller repeat protein [Treponema sp.]